MSGPAKFRRIQPAEVEAIQYLPGRGESCNCAEVDAFTDTGADPCTDEDCSLWAWDSSNADGTDYSAQPGDWIVKVADGAFEVHTAEMFAERFEAIS